MSVLSSGVDSRRIDGVFAAWSWGRFGKWRLGLSGRGRVRRWLGYLDGHRGRDIVRMTS